MILANTDRSGTLRNQLFQTLEEYVTGGEMYGKS